MTFYHNFLRRAADQSGESYWDTQLANGVDRASVLTNFSEGAENVALVAPVIAHEIFLG